MVPLSLKEEDILELVVVKGFNTKQVAKAMNMDYHSVRYNTTNILKKMESRTMAQAGYKFFVLNR